MLTRVMMIFAILMQISGSHAAITQSPADTTVPKWMRHAIIYGVKPSEFTDSGSHRSITKKLPEIRELGANVIWIQPVFKTFQGGQGYDIIDFFALRDDLGTAEELKELIDSAHAMKLKVIFDFVPNHSSIHHPYAKDVIKYGTASKYYDYYQHEDDGAPYSSHYNRDSSGFFYYFWKPLVNLNYNNAEVQQMIIDACKYWIKAFDIDGYRFDAVWAVNARAPQFMQRLRNELRLLKPDFFMLAEDRGSDPAVFKKGFDATYDWTSDTGWVSHWSWQYEYHDKKNLTVFVHPSINKRKELLKKAIFPAHQRHERIMRFMENNDVPRFASTHSPRQTKMAAQLLFALPGIPLIYNGQETGVKSHPYSKKPIYLDAYTIREQDSANLFEMYRHLITQRLSQPALTAANIEEIPLTPGTPAIAFRRWDDIDEVVVVINTDSVPVETTLDIYHGGGVLTDLLTGEKFKKGRGKSLRLRVEGYGARWLSEKKDSQKQVNLKKQ